MISKVNKTIYECVLTGEHGINYADTSREAIAWLEDNGGGRYFDRLHQHGFNVHGKGEKK